MCKYLLPFIAFSFININLSYADTKPLRDPTRPPHKKQVNSTSTISQTPGWYLTSTLIAQGRRHAVINGQLVSLGETIQKAKLVSIEPNKVWLVFNKKRFSINLLAKDIKDFSKSAAK